MHAPGPTTPRAWPGGAKAPPTPGSSEDAPAGAAFARRNSLNCRTPAPKGLLPPTRRSRGGGFPWRRFLGRKRLRRASPSPSPSLPRPPGARRSRRREPPADSRARPTASRQGGGGDSPNPGHFSRKIPLPPSLSLGRKGQGRARASPPRLLTLLPAA